MKEDLTVVGCGGWSKRTTLYGGDHQLEAAESSFLDPTTDAAKIRAIFVHPDYARQGLGSLLLKIAEDAAIKAGFMRFEMGSTLAGVPLYMRKGYEVRNSIEVPVGSGQMIEVKRMSKSIAG